MTVLLVVLLVLALVPLAGLYRLFEKAGRKGWEALIPFYNFYVATEIVGRPRYTVALLLIPIVDAFIVASVLIELCRSFGKDRLRDAFFVLVFPYVYLPYLGFNDHAKYLGKASALPPTPKSASREWTEAITFAVVAATLIRWLIMEAYTIPTPSMENSLLVGDFLFVSKFHYGTRTPRTPLQIPLTHQKIWFTEIPSYLRWIQLPTYRLPGFTTVHREDVVVFNVPGIAENEGVDYPIDLKTNYIKRCVAISGDTLLIKARQVIVNHHPLVDPPEMQFSYLVTTKDEIGERNFQRMGIDRDDHTSFTSPKPNLYVYGFFMTKEKAEEIKKLPFVISVEDDYTKHRGPIADIFSQSKFAPWNLDDFGPLIIPKKGMTIHINDSTLAFYGKVIRLYDHNDQVDIVDGKLKIDGKEVTEYTFKQNYYFMMGDNRHNSLDSRYWGFVPEDHIVGKAFFIWLSINRDGSWFHKIRWNRFFKMIH